MGEKPANGRPDPDALNTSCYRPLELQVLNAEELALRSQQGCKESFEELVERYGARLYQFLHNKTYNVQDAEDLVQDTFVKAYRNIHRYRNSWKFSTWLFTIAARLASSRYRSLKRRQSIGETGAGSIEPADAASQQEMQEGLWVVARTLSAGQYRALWLRYAEEMPIKEIAKVLGKTQVGVKVTLYRARVNLAQRLRNIAAENKVAGGAPQNEQLPVLKAEGA
jgi:RNA polymerase sigma-70 factor (ECF subfamily)